MIPIVAGEDSGSTLEALDLYEELRRKRNRTREEIVAAERFRRELEGKSDEFRSVIERTLEQAGADELVAATEAGILTVDPILSGDDFDFEEFLRAFVDKLADLLTASLSYRVFSLEIDVSDLQGRTNKLDVFGNYSGRIDSDQIWTPVFCDGNPAYWESIGEGLTC